MLQLLFYAINCLNAAMHTPGQDQQSHAGTDFQHRLWPSTVRAHFQQSFAFVTTRIFLFFYFFFVNITFSFSNPFQIPKMIQIFLEVAVLASFSGNVDFEYLKVRSPNLSLDIWKSDQGLAVSVSNRDLKLFSQKIISEIWLRTSATREKRWEIIF